MHRPSVGDRRETRRRQDQVEEGARAGHPPSLVRFRVSILVEAVPEDSGNESSGDLEGDGPILAEE